MFTCHICNKRIKRAYYCIDESVGDNPEFYGLKGSAYFCSKKCFSTFKRRFSAKKRKELRDSVINSEEQFPSEINESFNKIYAILTKSEKIRLTIIGIFFTSSIMKGTTIKDFFNHMHPKNQSLTDVTNKEENA